MQISLGFIVSFVMYILEVSDVLFYRIALAAMHFNENSTRTQATTSDGTARYAVEYPKGKFGEPSVRPLKTDPTFGKYPITQEAEQKLYNLFHSAGV